MLLCVLIGLFNIVLRHRGDAYHAVTPAVKRDDKRCNV